MLRILSVLFMLTGVLLVAPVATATNHVVPTHADARQVPTVKVDLRVIGNATPIPSGTQSGGCTDTTFTAGQTVKVRDARTGKKLAVGQVGRCQYEMTSESICIAGLGCTPALLSPVYKLSLPRLPVVGISKYVITIGTHRFQIGPRKLDDQGWQHYFSA